MNLTTSKRTAAAAVGGLLTIPAVYFISITLVKYVLGFPYLFDQAEPVLETLGIQEGIGLNINLLIIFGPFLAFLLNMLSVWKIHITSSRSRVDCHIEITKSAGNFFMLLTSLLTLVILFGYLAMENCAC